jgi:hypothetical protein
MVELAIIVGAGRAALLQVKVGGDGGELRWGLLMRVRCERYCVARRGAAWRAP